MNTRVEKYCDWKGGLAESLDFGTVNAQNIVVKLLICDGDKKRSQRQYIFDPRFIYFGARFYQYIKYKKCSVFSNAGYIQPKDANFTEKELIRNYLNIHKYFINKNRDEIDKIIKNEKEVIKKEDEEKIENGKNEENKIEDEKEKEKEKIIEKDKNNNKEKDNESIEEKEKDNENEKEEQINEAENNNDNNGNKKENEKEEESDFLNNNLVVIEEIENDDEKKIKFNLEK